MRNTMLIEKLKNIDKQYTHPSYTLERKLIREIQLGLLNDSMQTLHQINKLEKPFLALDMLRSIKNSLIASCTLFTRAVIEAGVNSEDVFGMSDSFIKHIELIDNEKTLLQFEYEMVEEFVKMTINFKEKQYLYPISKVVTYINQNPGKKITVPDLAELVHFSPDYLSRYFHEQVGVSIIDYIHYNKIKIAKYFLEFRDMSITDISNILEFCNAAYFSNIFKKQTGMSPSAYRKSCNLNH